MLYLGPSIISTCASGLVPQVITCNFVCNSQKRSYSFNHSFIHYRLIPAGLIPRHIQFLHECIIVCESGQLLSPYHCSAERGLIRRHYQFLYKCIIGGGVSEIKQNRDFSGRGDFRKTCVFSGKGKILKTNHFTSENATPPTPPPRRGKVALPGGGGMHPVLAKICDEERGGRKTKNLIFRTLPK